MRDSDRVETGLVPSVQSRSFASRRFLLLLPTLLFLAACGGESAEVADPPAAAASDDVVVDELMSAWVDTWNRDDAEGIRGMYADDVVVLIGSGPAIQGADSVQARFTSTNLPIASDLTHSRIQEGQSGDLAYLTGTYTQRLELPDVAPYTQVGRFNFVWARQPDASWKLRSILIDPDPAPAQ